MPTTPESLTGLHPDLPFLSMSVVLCALFVWLANFGLKRFIPFPGRALATMFVAIHVLLLGIYLIADLSGTPFLPLDVWDFDREWTVASVNSTIQVVLLASLCFLNAIVPAKRHILERLFWMVSGFGFAGFSLLEYQAFDRYLFPETFLLGLFGTIVAASSLIMILRHRKQVVQRFCLLLLPVGLGIFASGYFLDETIILGNSRGEPYEETLELLGIAVALTGVAGYVATNLPRQRIQWPGFLASVCLTNVALGILLLGVPVWEDRVFPEARFLWSPIGKRINADIGGGSFALLGWDAHFIGPGKPGKMLLLLQALRLLDYDFGFSAQLIDQASGGDTLTINRVSEIKVRKWAPGYEFEALLNVPLIVPETAPTNRAQWLTVSFWKNEGDDYPLLKIDLSDYPLLGDTHIILDELVLKEPAGSLNQNEALAVFANGFALQHAVIPGRARAGRPMNVEFQWSSISDGEEDWTQLLHFVPEADGSFWNIDQYPLGLRLPTRLWYAGMLSDQHWNFMIPPDLEAGTYHVFTGLYRLADLQRLEVTLANGQQPDDRLIPLGSIAIES